MGKSIKKSNHEFGSKRLFSWAGDVNISYRVGDQLVAVENGQVRWTGRSPRVPARLVVQARIEWITTSKIHICLPESQVLINGDVVVLPRITHKLDRHIKQAPWENQGGEPGAPCEWKHQPFYPKIRGRWCTAQKATYYNYDAWKAYSHFITEEPHQPKDIVLERCAQELGVEYNADRKEIGAAFRLKAKQVHPDFGGSPDEFQRLLAARNTLLVKCSNF